MVLTESTANWIGLVVGYGLLAASARLTWLAMRGWHAFSKEEVPSADLVAIAIPWSFVFTIAAIDWPILDDWRLVIAGLGGIVLALVMVLNGRSAVGLQWRALGTDPTGLTRLGVRSLSVVSHLVVLDLILLAFSAAVLSGLDELDVFGHWGYAGLVLLLLGGRLGPILIVVSVAATVGQALAETTELEAPHALSTLMFCALLLFASRWREPEAVLHVD